MNRKYSNPPIVEALCEFQFIPSQIWDMTIPGLLYEKIKGTFPQKQEQKGYRLALRPKKGGMEQKVEISQRMQFFRPDKSALVQVSSDMLTINHLKPYPTWETFKPLIFDNLEKYQQVANPKGFKRIGLRYINKIDIDRVPIEWNNYFNYYPFIPKEFLRIHEAVNLRVEIPYKDGSDRLRLILASTIPEEADVLSLLLDIDYFMAVPEHIPLNQAADWIEKAHSTIEDTFEMCITDKCRSLFEGEK